MGIDPQHLGHFKITANKVKWEIKRLTERAYEAKVVRQKAFLKRLKTSASEATEQNLWEARKVDEDSCKKDGINYAIG